MTRHHLCTAVILASISAAVCGSAFAQTFFPGRSFTSSTLITDSGFFPPDTMGTVGVDHYVELINGRFGVFRKSDGVRVQTSNLNAFFTNAGVATTSSFDPRVVYDPFVRRWYAAAADNSNSGASSYLFAISTGSDPTAPWKGFRIDADSANADWLDFPMLGFNRDAIVLSGN